MSIVVADFPRHFQVWRYTVSHKLLLLRSNRRNESDTRVDVLFTVVHAMCLPTMFHGLWIMKLTQEEAEVLFPNVVSSVNMLKESVFALHGENYSGYVVAQDVHWREEEKDYSEPSSFGTPWLDC